MTNYDLAFKLISTNAAVFISSIIIISLWQKKQNQNSSPPSIFHVLEAKEKKQPCCLHVIVKAVWGNAFKPAALQSAGRESVKHLHKHHC